MLTFEEFRTKLRELVNLVPQIERDLKNSRSGVTFHTQPEATTKDRLLEPFLEALGFDAEHRAVEYSVRQSKSRQPAWVDYCLRKSSEDYEGLALLEAKSLLEEDIWKKHQKQTRTYLNQFQLMHGDQDTARWIILTNFRELYILNIADYEPFFKLTYTEYDANADLLFRLLNRGQLSNDQITDVYYEKRHVPLGKSFLNDLKLWRLLIANGLKQAQPDLTLEQIKLLSQLVLNRVIFVRILETYGLHPYYSLVRRYSNWKKYTRNPDSFSFFDEHLSRAFIDIELDLNTELFKNTYINEVCEVLAEIQGRPVTNLTIPNRYIEPLVNPDVFWPDKDQELRELTGYQTGQQRFTLSTPYNYDFHTLTQDIMGQVYEQFLAQNLIMVENHILLRSDQTLRQDEGIYYTPGYVVKFLVEGSLGQLVNQIIGDAEQHLHSKKYTLAQISINKLRAIKVIDLACGSGQFLVAAHALLVRAYEKWNQLVNETLTEHFDNNLADFADSGLGAESNVGQLVLMHNIFGIDKDLQAVNVTKLNLWTEVLRTESAEYARFGDRPPKHKLPSLTSHIIHGDAIYGTIDIDELLGGGHQHRIILGNPPWGSDLNTYGSRLGTKFVLARGQYDSYELFIERATQCLRPGDILGYIIPDSILQTSERSRTRSYILEHYQMDTLIRLGEDIFEDVFRGSVTFIFTRSNNVPESHKVQCRIIVKDERNQIIRTSRENTIQALLNKSSSTITQNHFVKNENVAFDIFMDDEDAKIIVATDNDALNWKEITITGRGTELSKAGEVMACSHCNIWQNIPRKKKNGTYEPVKCANSKCQKLIAYEECTKKRIISPVKTREHTEPIVVGEGINRYQIIDTRFIDISKVKFVPRCPNLTGGGSSKSKKTCGDYDSAARPFIPGEIRTCQKCGLTYTEKDVKEWVRLGINYKPYSLYEGEKIFIRKTGRGIYATIDRKGLYTNQAVFIFKLNPERPEKYKKLRLSYILGVLNSRMMLYRYYKKVGEIEWRSFPYITQKTIMELPIKSIDFTNFRQSYLHDCIADLVDNVISSNRVPNENIDLQIERLVRELYNVDTPTESARIDSELARISQYGSLLGSSTDEELLYEEVG